MLWRLEGLETGEGTRAYTQHAHTRESLSRHAQTGKCEGAGFAASCWGSRWHKSGGGAGRAAWRQTAAPICPVRRAEEQLRTKPGPARPRGGKREPAERPAPARKGVGKEEPEARCFEFSCRRKEPLCPLKGSDFVLELLVLVGMVRNARRQRSYWDSAPGCGHLLQMLHGTLHITPGSTGGQRAGALLQPRRPDETHTQTHTRHAWYTWKHSNQQVWE